MSDLSCDECRGCGVWVNCWGDADFYATQLCEDCRRPPQEAGGKPSRPDVTPLYPSRSVKSRRDDVIRLLTGHLEYSDRVISRIVSVSRKMVSAIRGNLIRKSLIASHHALRRVGADGKVYKRLPKAKAPRKPLEAVRSRQEACLEANGEFYRAMARIDPGARQAD